MCCLASWARRMRERRGSPVGDRVGRTGHRQGSGGASGPRFPRVVTRGCFDRRRPGLEERRRGHEGHGDCRPGGSGRHGHPRDMACFAVRERPKCRPSRPGRQCGKLHLTGFPWHHKLEQKRSGTDEWVDVSISPADGTTDPVQHGWNRLFEELLSTSRQGDPITQRFETGTSQPDHGCRPISTTQPLTSILGSDV